MHRCYFNSSKSKKLPFPDSRISKSLIQGWDAALTISSFRPDVRLRDFSRPAQGARRQHCDRRFRRIGIGYVLHAERVVSGLSAHAGERPGPLRRHEEKVRRRNTKEIFRYRWIEAVPLRDGRDAMVDNWIGFEIFDAKGKVKYSMAW
jgi:hypothetical protein